MQIELRPLHRKVCFVATCLVLAGLYLWWTARAYVASHLAANLNPENIQKAISLEPSNAEYLDLLARNVALSTSQVEDAIALYQKALGLNPYVARYWLDLAGAYEIAGRVEQQEQSVERAVEADPTTPHVAWEAANLFLIQGDPGKALRYFRIVFANDPEAVDSTMQLCWRTTGDVNQILDVLPRKPNLYLSFLRLLISKEEVAAAENVWDHLIGLNETFPSKLAFPYFRLLINKQEVEPAQKAWRQLADLDPWLKSYLSSPQNLIVNGGFEENMLNGGFDWWYELNSHAALAIDDSESFSGTRSLSVTFDGQSARGAGILQFIVVKPNTDYEFSAECKTEDLETASGTRFAIVDAYTNASYVLTDDLLGTNPWRLQEAQFRTGPNTHLLLLTIIREPANPLIRGKVWFDDLRLRERQTEDQQP